MVLCFFLFKSERSDMDAVCDGRFFFVGSRPKLPLASPDTSALSRSVGEGVSKNPSVLTADVGLGSFGVQNSAGVNGARRTWLPGRGRAAMPACLSDEGTSSVPLLCASSSCEESRSTKLWARRMESAGECDDVRDSPRLKGFSGDI